MKNTCGSYLSCIGGAEGEVVELNASPFNKRGFIGPILIQREPVPPRDFLLVVLGEPHAHDELVIVQIDLVHEILENLVSNPLGTLALVLGEPLCALSKVALSTRTGIPPSTTMSPW